MSPLDGAQTRDCGLPQEGLVVAIAHGYSEVAAGDQSYLCMLRGRLLKRRAPTPALRRPLPPPHRRARQERTTAATAQAAVVEAAPNRPPPGDHVVFSP